MATVYDYFQRAYRRDSAQSGGVLGDKCVDSDGNTAVFCVAASAGCVTSASYRCTTCCTLVGLCEHLAQAVVGCTLDDAASWTPERLLLLHPEIPPVRRDRAALAVGAVQSALRKSIQGARN